MTGAAPDAVVDGFFAAVRAGEFEAARGFVAEDARVTVHALPAVETGIGFDGFLEYFAHRRLELGVASWHEHGRLTGAAHVALLLRIRAGERVWQLLILAAVTDGLIRALWFHEPF